MSESKQVVLPLWGNAASARTITIISRGHLNELCDMFIAAAETKDEAGMQAAIETMHTILERLGTFQRAQFRKWAKEREAQRR